MLGIGRTGVVVPRRVDGDHADVQVAAEPLGEGGEVVVEVEARRAHRDLADRIGTESMTPSGRGERLGGLAPACAGEEDDGRDVEEDAVERRAHAVRVDLGEAGDVEQDRRRAALELLDGAPGSRRCVDDLADVPSAAPGARAISSGAGASAAVYSGSMTMPSYVVERRRSSATSGSTFSALATAASQSSRVADAVMAPGYGTPQPLAASAKAAIEVNRQSGVTGAAAGVAPVPVRSWRRSIHTVGRPAALAGTWSW